MRNLHKHALYFYRMKWFAYLPAVLLLFAGCKSSKYSINEPDKNGGVVMSIERTPCFGACPVFTATLYENGLLLYNGKRFTYSLGCHYAIIPKAEINKVRAWFEDAGIYLMKDKYPEQDIAPTDLPSCILTYKKGKKAKTVVDRGWETPQQVTDLQTKVDTWVSMQNLQSCDK